MGGGRAHEACDGGRVDVVGDTGEVEDAGEHVAGNSEFALAAVADAQGDDRESAGGRASDDAEDAGGAAVGGEAEGGAGATDGAADAEAGETEEVDLLLTAG